MKLVIKYLADYLQFKLSLIFGGRKDYEVWRAKSYLLNKTEIKNKKIAHEIEKACKKSDGGLTYEEFLHIDQFGVNGYHATSKNHGITYAYKHWGKALARVCQKKNISHVLELGPGAGDLAIQILKEAKKVNYEITWSGVELSSDFRREIKKRFKDFGLRDKLEELVADISELKSRQQSLVVFSYSLDSIPPQIFINTRDKRGYPNAIIGIKINKGEVQEIVLDENMLRKKGLGLDKGIYHDEGGLKFDISSWNLYPFQRAYIPFKAFFLFARFAGKFPTSTFVIIDEFRPPPSPFDIEHLGVPKDLNRFKRDLDNLEKSYKETGSNLLYYPFYFMTFYKFIHALGFRSIKYDIEQRMAREITGESWVSLKGFFSTYAFIVSDKDASRDILPIEFPKTKLI